MDNTARKTWISVLIAAIVIVAIIGVSIVAAGAMLFYRHVNSSLVAADTAQTTIDEARARFSGQQPLVEIRGGDEPVVHRERVGDAPPHQIAALHVLAYDPRSRKLVRADVPGWVLRFVSRHGKIRLAGDSFWDNQEQLTLDDLERHGPGLVLDAHDRRGAQVLVWTE